MSPGPRPRPWPVTAVLVLIALTWPVLVLHALASAVSETFSLIGDPPTAAARSRAVAHLVRGAVCAVVLPVLGLALDRLTGGRGRRWLIAVVLGLVAAAALLAGAAETRSSRSVPAGGGASASVAAPGCRPRPLRRSVPWR